MKKYLKTIGNIIKYSVIYYVLQIISGFFLGVICAIKYPKDQFHEAIMSNIYSSVGISAILTFLIYMLLLKNKEKNLFEICKFKKINFINYVYISLTAISFSFISCKFVQKTQYMFESYNEVSNSIGSVWVSFFNDLSLTSVFNVFCILVLIPFFEEILFRGLIFNELKKQLNLIVSIILQALIFAALHGNVLQGIYTFSLGIILALIYNYTKSIWSSITLHIIYNIMGSLVMPIIVHSFPQYSTLFAAISIIVLILCLIKLYKIQEKKFIFRKNIA